MVNVALGFRAHSGWAAMVAVTDSLVIDRRRIQLADPRIRGAVQPYHAAKPMSLADAEAFLDHCRIAAQHVAEMAIRDVIADLASKGYAARSACVLLGSGRTAGSLAATLRSHPMIHTAEGDFFRDVVKAACESSGLPIIGVKEKELLSQTTSDAIAAAGKGLGPPWTQDEKLCTLAAWLSLKQQPPRTSSHPPMARTSPGFPHC
jgi:hypothetical protein